MNLGPGKFFIEGIYISGDSNDNTNKYKSIITLNDTAASPGGPSFFARTDMMILLPNADDINTNTALIGAAADPGSSLASFEHGVRHEPGKLRPRHLAHWDRLHHAAGQTADRESRRRLPGGDQEAG